MTWVCSDCGTRNKQKEQLCIFCGEPCEKEPSRFFVREKLEWDIYSLNGEQTEKLPFFRFGNIMRIVFIAWFISLFIAFGSAVFHDNFLDYSSNSGDGLMGRTIDDRLPILDGVEGILFSNRLSEITRRVTIGDETSIEARQPHTERINAVLNDYFEDFYENRILYYRDAVLHNINRLRGKD